MPGADQCVPVDVYIPGGPPRPEQVIHAILLLQQRIAEGGGVVVEQRDRAARRPRTLTVLD